MPAEAKQAREEMLQAILRVITPCAGTSLNCAKMWTS